MDPIETEAWMQGVPAFLVIVIGVGALAGAILTIMKLYQTLFPDKEGAKISQLEEEIHDLKRRVAGHAATLAALETVTHRIATIEGKIDRVTEMLMGWKGPK